MATKDEDHEVEHEDKSIEKYPLHRFPVEVWDLIFSHLNNRQDLITCHNTSRAWESIFKDKRAVLFFPEVFPFIVRALDRSDILACRRTHPVWKQAVDIYLQNRPSHFKLDTFYDPCNDEGEDKDEYLRRESFWLKYMYWFESSQEIQHFLLRMTDYAGKNPFISRSLTCLDNKMDPAESSDMWRSAKALVASFGTEIWHCDFVFSCNHNPIHFYKILRHCLNFMPNLRTFEVCYYGDHHLFNYLEIISLEELVRLEPLPRLKSLVKLKVASLPSPVLIEALSRNSLNIEKLQLNKPCPFRNTYEFGQPNRDPPRLTKLEELCMALYSREDLQMLGMTTSSCWPLTTLSLEDLSDDRISLHSLFYTVGRFGETLKTFIYKVSTSNFKKRGATIIGNDPNLRLHLPHLEILKIYAEHVRLGSIDFTLPLVKLKELVLVVEDGGVGGGVGCSGRISPWKGGKGRKAGKVFGGGFPGGSGGAAGGCGASGGSEGIIRFSGYLNKMYDSNIWEILHNLHTICIKVNTGLRPRNNNGHNELVKYSYVRDMYKDYCCGLKQLRIY
ncbi:unnamed protein product [Orchesella dallaii]|uniref:F-box domain-containing protein n=1 Tax=Orchesella dallaii TaxID=48710 RepID=A0ABP1RGH0_9HEXA